jgi:hypothetical protein
LHWIKSRPLSGLSTDPTCVHQGANSGYQAINLAYNLGAQRILLLGFDCGVHNGKSHWFGDHPKGLQKASPYQRMQKAFRTIVPEHYGIEIINCSRTTAIDAFERLSIDKAVRR